MRAMHEAVIAIKNDKIHGAGYLTDKALEAVKNAVQTSQARNPEEFLREISGLTYELQECRPAMASIANCSSRFRTELQKDWGSGTDLNSLRAAALTIVQNIKRDFIRARDQAIEAGASLIENKDVIMTCSYSSTIVQTMARARGQGKSFQIMAAESREFPGAVAYGDKMAADLSGQGIKCHTFPDTDIRTMAPQADKIMVGADAILPDGSLLNGYPTAELALAAGDANLPFYTICESPKFLPRGKIETLEKGFNLVPSRLVSAVVSEKGILTPYQIDQLTN
ncbi:MAG: hypothetical protein VB084_05470 [Syntrophomonadaceae bacterium]|nr:hypothetical protein [Syntrophomonadaceae bacterium]